MPSLYAISLPHSCMPLIQERLALPKFAGGGPWQAATPDLRALHDWLFQENTAYATKRLGQERPPLDPALLKSY
jgi:hypothetical protein